MDQKYLPYDIEVAPNWILFGVKIEGKVYQYDNDAYCTYPKVETNLA